MGTKTVFLVLKSDFEILNNDIALVIIKQHSPCSQSDVSISKNQWQSTVSREWHLLQSFHALTRQLAFYNVVIIHLPQFFLDFGNVSKFTAKQNLLQEQIAIAYEIGIEIVVFIASLSLQN